MIKYIVAVEGKLLVEAPDKDAAKKAVEGSLAIKAPWLKASYGEPTPVTAIEEVDLRLLAS